MKSGHVLLSAAVLALSVASLGHAAGTNGDAGISGLTLKGFGTLGLARSDEDGAQYVRDLSQPDGLTSDWSGKIDSMIGLQASYQVNEAVEGVLQAISRYRYDGSYRPEISWAFVRYEASPALSLRAGRLGTEFYMQADSRQVGYANPTVRPPPDYFGPLVFSYLDGFDLGAATPVGAGLLKGKLFAGLSPETTPFVRNVSWDLDGALLVGGHLEYQSGPWQFRLGHAQVHFDTQLPLHVLAGFDVIALVPDLSVKDTWSRFDSLGMVYDEGPLQLQLMLSRTRHESAAYEDTKAGYAIASYRFGQVTPYLGYSRVKSTPARIGTPVTPELAELVTNLTSATHSDQHTWFLGGRWDIRENLAMKAQVDWLHGSRTSLFPFRDDIPVWDGDMTVYSLTLDFVF